MKSVLKHEGINACSTYFMRNNSRIKIDSRAHARSAGITVRASRSRMSHHPITYLSSISRKERIRYCVCMCESAAGTIHCSKKRCERTGYRNQITNENPNENENENENDYFVHSFVFYLKGSN
jgi:hypothetical protein